MKLDIFKWTTASITKIKLNKPVSLHHSYDGDCVFN
jgi:hypothetical protein